MSIHTPGPWRTTGLNVRAGDALICYASNHWADDETPESERQANADLIASAPDLLSALERLAHPMADDDDLDYARAIIRKARGLSVKSHE
jgi:hypothetical protein